MADKGTVKKRKELISDILIKAGDRFVSGVEIRQEIEKKFGKGVSKGVLSENIKELKKEGFEIESGTSGYRYRGSRDSLVQTDEELMLMDEYEPSTADVVAEWLIMLVFAKERDRLIDIKTIKKECNELTSFIKQSSIREHVNVLVQKGYLSVRGGEDKNEIFDQPTSAGSRYYQLTESAPVITVIDEEALEEFNEYYYDRGYESELRDVLTGINEKATAVSPTLYTGNSGSIRSFGRKNDIPERLTQKLEKILHLDFKKHALDIEYEEKEEIRKYIFNTALIIFNVETNTFYLLGEALDRRKRWGRKFFKLELVREAVVNTEVKNTIYESKKYKELFGKMWSCAPDEPKEIEVLFRNDDEIKGFVKVLAEARKDTAEISLEGKHIRYSDSIIGLHDFLRTVRSLGEAAEIIKPEGSRKHMIEKTKDIINCYKEILD